MRSQPASYHGYRFPPDIISHAVWLYHRFCLSFRDAEDLLAQRGVTPKRFDALPAHVASKFDRCYLPEPARADRTGRRKLPGGGDQVHPSPDYS